VREPEILEDLASLRSERAKRVVVIQCTRGAAGSGDARV
jgi:hypothetical protein